MLINSFSAPALANNGSPVRSTRLEATSSQPGDVVTLSQNPEPGDPRPPFRFRYNDDVAFGIALPALCCVPFAGFLVFGLAAGAGGSHPGGGKKGAMLGAGALTNLAGSCLAITHGLKAPLGMLGAAAMIAPAAILGAYLVTNARPADEIN